MIIERIRTTMTISVLVLTTFFLFTGGLSSAQEQFKMDVNTFQDFTMAKRMFQKGEQLFIKGKYDKSEKTLIKCLEEFPKYSQADYYLSQIYYKKGELNKALEHIDTAKKNFGFMANLLVAAQQKYREELKKEKDKLNASIIDLPNDRHNNQVKERMQNELKELNDRLTEPLPVFPEESADYYYFHGNILMKMKKFNNAHAQYLKAVKLDPKHGNAYNNLANLYYMIKKYKEALSYLEKAEASGAKVNPKFKNAVLAGIKKSEE